jgi:hypothetical protein
MSTYHKQATSRQSGQVPAHYRTQAPPYLVPDHGAPHRPAHHEADQRGLCLVAATNQQVAGQQRAPRAASTAYRELELSAAAHPGFCGKHARPPPSGGAGGSNADPGPALPAPGGEDRAARPGAHPQPEPMRLGAASVVRLERALAHRRLHIWAGRRGQNYRVSSLAGRPRGAPAHGKLPGKALSRFTLRASLSTGQTSQRHRGDQPPPILAGRRNRRLPNAAPPARLGCGQPARPRGTGGAGQPQRSSGVPGTARSAACTACG